MTIILMNYSISLDHLSESNYISVENYNKQCSYNIRSFEENSNAMLTMFNNRFSHPDLIILSETWFTEGMSR